ncbi:MAG: DUF3000 domain-containing protein [Aeromicrobium sp.]|nr:MAG: DUF3000 domain-containing protein [Aeromicrobium sp.]
MSANTQLADTPEVFTQAVAEIARIQARPELEISEMPPPRKIAPFAHAITGDVYVHDEEVGTGRFVLLHDPAGHDAWNGTFRCVTFAKAEIDQEMANDPLLTEVGWSWLIDALNSRHAEFIRTAGSVTVVRSEGYGDMREDPATAQIEIRASWTPQGSIGAHVEAWTQLLAQISGLPPEVPGVVSLASKRVSR